MNKQVANVQLMQKMNRLKALNFVRSNPDCSRPQIAQATGLSLPSVTNITTYLLELGILCENGTEEVSRVGRKSVLLRLCASKYDLICVYLKETSAIITRTDLEGAVKEKVLLEIKGLSSDVITRKLCEAIISLVNSYEKEKVLGIGVAISGLVLSDSRFVMSSRLKWKSFDIKKLLEAETGIPVFVDNVSVLKAAQYFSGHFKNNDQNALFVDLENGIGAVPYMNGAIQRAILGEIGHTTIEKDGPQCFCGNKGCLEMMCSPQRLLSLYEASANKTVSSVETIQELANSGDKEALAAISDCGTYLGMGLANLVNIFNPVSIIINTGDFSMCPMLLDVAEEELRKRAYAALTKDLSVIHIKETEENIIFGTAFDLCDKLFDISFPKNIIE